MLVAAGNQLACLPGSCFPAYEGAYVRACVRAIARPYGKTFKAFCTSLRLPHSGPRIPSSNPLFKLLLGGEKGKGGGGGGEKRKEEQKKMVAKSYREGVENSEWRCVREGRSKDG